MTRAAIIYCLKRRLLNVLSSAMYSRSQCQAGTSMINIQSTLRTAPELYKNLHSQYHLVEMAIHLLCLHSQICILTLYNTETVVRQKKHKNSRHQWMPRIKKIPLCAVGWPVLV